LPVLAALLVFRQKVGDILAVAGANHRRGSIASDRGLGYLMIQVQSSLDTPAW